MILTKQINGILIIEAQYSIYHSPIILSYEQFVGAVSFAPLAEIRSRATNQN